PRFDRILEDQRPLQRARGDEDAVVSTVVVAVEVGLPVVVAAVAVGIEVGLLEIELAWPVELAGRVALGRIRRSVVEGRRDVDRGCPDQEAGRGRGGRG